MVELVGPRQVGKTSILDKMFSGFNYVSLGVAANAEAADTRPREFLQKYSPPVVRGCPDKYEAGWLPSAGSLNGWWRRAAAENPTRR